MNLWKELQRIGDGVSAQGQMFVDHPSRLGDLDIGNISVAIPVSSPHRSKAYATNTHTPIGTTDRYARQIRFSLIGEQGQSLLAESRVAFVGVGVLGERYPIIIK